MRLIQAITGSAFLIFSGICCAARYIMAAVLGINFTSSSDFFPFMWSVVPVPLTVVMYASLAIGIILIVLSLEIMKKADTVSEESNEE